MAKKNSLTFPSVKESRWSWSRQSVSPPLSPPPPPHLLPTKKCVK